MLRTPNYINSKLNLYEKLTQLSRWLYYKSFCAYVYMYAKSKSENTSLCSCLSWPDVSGKEAVSVYGGSALHIWQARRREAPLKANLIYLTAILSHVAWRNSLRLSETLCLSSTSMQTSRQTSQPALISIVGYKQHGLLWKILPYVY